jgi:Mg2+/Co2+ transporter CorB
MLSLDVSFDEYGEVRGAIVVEDILEEIVGQFTSNQNEIIWKYKLTT